MEKVKNAILLAGGNSSRMKTGDSKIFLNFMGIPLAKHMVKLLSQVSDKITIIVSPKNRDKLQNLFKDTEYTSILKLVEQKEALGTGDATEIGLKALDVDNGEVLIVNCDAPLITVSSLKNMIISYREEKDRFKLKFLSFKTEKILGYGRVVHLGNSLKIIEEKELTENQRKLYKEGNSGIYIGDVKSIGLALEKIDRTVNCEKYLTTIISLLPSLNILLKDFNEGLGVNTIQQYIELLQIAKKRIIDSHIENGVLIYDPELCWIDQEVQIAQGTIIKGRTVLLETTTINKNCSIEDSRIDSGVIDSGCKISSSSISKSLIGSDTVIGPYTHIRANNNIGKENRIGSFCELSNVQTSTGCKIPHLSYLGKAKLGEKVNFGAGSIIANYNGEIKSETEIGNHVFIGANNTLIAPLLIENNSYTAGGSTINKKVKSGEIAIERSEQINKVFKKNPYLKNKKQGDESNDILK